MSRKYTPRIRTQLRQAQRVERQNKISAAEGLYREIIKEHPEVSEAWVGLGNMVADPAEKEKAYQQALVLDPDNNVARAALGMELIPEPQPEPQPEPEGAAAAKPATPAPAKSKTTAAKLTPAPKMVKEARDNTSVAVPVATVATQVAPPVDKVAQPEKVEFAAPAVDAVADVDTVGELLICKNHPDRETSLRCYRCNEPICMTCAKRTSVGYLCPQCVYEAEEKFFTASKLDYIIGGAIALVLSSIAAWFASILGFWVIFVAAAVGTLIGTATFYAVGRRRGRFLPQTVAAMVVIGVAPAILGSVLFSFGSLSAVWLIVYVVLATSSAYYRMRY